MSKPVEHATVIGAGAMGTLCALVLAENGVRVALWGRSRDRVAVLRRDRQNAHYLPGYEFGQAILPTHDSKEAFERTGLIISAVPCQHIRSVWRQVGPSCPAGVPIISVAKGIEVETLLLPTQIIADVLSWSGPLGCLSGPCIAPEAAARKPTSVVVASEDEGIATLVQHAFSTDSFRVYRHEDVVGVELAGATKNVIALAAGICDGIEAGCNAKAALLTRGLVEITRLGVVLGGREDTFRGLAGIGDLVTTCISPVSRNRSAGERIGRGMATEDVIGATDSVIEGIPTTRSVLRLASRAGGVEMAITRAVASVLFEGCPPVEAIHRLMTRRLQREFR